jgi:hypothetical protein
VACITNNVRSGQGPGMAASTERAERMAEVMALFDLVVESSLEGIRKPNPRSTSSPAIDISGARRLPGRSASAHDQGVDEDQAIRELAVATGLA